MTIEEIRKIADAGRISRRAADEIIEEIGDEMNLDCSGGVPSVTGSLVFSDEEGVVVYVVYDKLIDRDAYDAAELDHAFDYSSPRIYVEGKEIEIEDEQED